MRPLEFRHCPGCGDQKYHERWQAPGPTFARMWPRSGYTLSRQAVEERGRRHEARDFAQAPCHTFAQ